MVPNCMLTPAAEDAAVHYRAPGIPLLGFKSYLSLVCSADPPPQKKKRALIAKQQVEVDENVCKLPSSFLPYCELMIRQQWSTRLEGTAGLSRSCSALALSSSNGVVE